ncbi:MAG: hypothetical protein IJD13_08200 [Oscillospiraceae bacterium]|nr:hypothetical protein [Oscillospiraceae bacterium]
MTSKEIIRRLIAHDAPPRIGYDFKDRSDFKWVPSRRYIDLPDNPYDEWGEYPELKKLTGFSGEVRRDIYGNIYGRFNGKTKGECIRGVIEDWEDYRYELPRFDPAHREELLKLDLAENDKFILTGGASLFSSLRDARLMSNALADTLLDPEAVAAFMDKLAEYEVAVIKSIAGCGVDGWFITDDWGTQDRTFISPASFRELFKPAYKKVADAAHEAGMAVFLHSCGYIYPFMEDFIDAGIDVFQFDQPDAYPAEVLAKEFAGRAVFHSPVDIQKILPTGDRDLIERRAGEMCRMFREAGGGWISKDYPTYIDIGVETAWAHWAEDIILANSTI